MNLIFNNPYRILGLPITASEREIAKQINTLATYAAIGKTKSFETDYSFLPTIARTEVAIDEATKQIERNENKFLYSLFWFWNNNSVDEIAIEVLKGNNTNKAIDIWQKSVFTNKNNIYKPITLFENLIKSSSDFDNVDNENHILINNGGEYIVDRKAESNYSIPTAFADFNCEGNWSIECKTEWLSGVDNNGYGIVFGRDKGNFYSFQISANGYFTYAKYVDWKYTALKEWQKDDSINKLDENIILIEKINDTLFFKINDFLVYSYVYEPFFGKSYGFRVTQNQKISFKNFKFSKLIEDESYGLGINITSKNYSNIKNLSILYLCLTINNGTLHLDKFKKGIALAGSFFSAENIEEYSKLISGERYIYNSETTIYFYLSEILDSLTKYLDTSGGISTKEFIDFFSHFPVEAKQFLYEKFVSKQLQNINKEIELAKNERKESKDKAIETGKKLIINTKSDLAYLKNILGENDFQYQIISDKLSLQIVQCGIDSFNYFKDSKGEIDYVKAIKSEEDYLKEYEYALQIAVSENAKKRAKENIDSCKDYIKNKHYYNCWFCGIRPPEDSSKFATTIYKENNRSYFPRRSVQFSYLPISISRCSDCQKIHSQSSDKFIFAIIGCAVVGLIIGAIADGYWIAGLIVGGVIGLILGSILQSQQTSKEAIKDTSQSTIRTHPSFSKLLSEGWQFSKPTA